MNVLTMLLSTAGDSFVRLFTEMNAWTIAVFILGIIFCAIEMFVPGFGFFGISGSVLVAAGIVLRMIFGGDLLMLLYMVLIALALFILMFWVFSRLITKSRLKKSALFSVDSAVPTGITEGTRDFSDLVGEVGVAVTSLHPIGLADFNNVTVDVVARNGYISKDAKVIVTHVEGQRVEVVESDIDK
ncbi:MAG: hypothetical protein J1G02_01285 [Clostridiales bacterium]|nr:hypothetical protein [Clostridiales bacterium]